MLRRECVAIRVRLEAGELSTLDGGMMPIYERLILIAFTTFIAGCDGGVSVVGSVHDPQDRPIAGAEIVLDCKNNSRAFHTSSSSTGRFSAGGTVAPGLYEYTLHVRASGFKEASAEVRTVSMNRIQAILQPANAADQSRVELVAATTCPQ